MTKSDINRLFMVLGVVFVLLLVALGYTTRHRENTAYDTNHQAQVYNCGSLKLIIHAEKYGFLLYHDDTKQVIDCKMIEKE